MTAAIIAEKVERLFFLCFWKEDKATAHQWDAVEWPRREEGKEINENIKNIAEHQIGKVSESTTKEHKED